MNLNILKIVLLCGVIGFSSCKKKENKEMNDVQEYVQSGTWKMTKFIDSGDDELYHFSSYTFTFSESGTVTASNGTNNYSGTWSITKSNSSDDDNDNSDLDFNIQFNLTNNFEDLNDDWDIISHSKTKIELIDVSGGNGGTDYLTFEKK